MKIRQIAMKKNAQHGAVLVVGLVMLLLLTLIGMAAIRGSSMQEKMVGNMRDHSLAFQSAEAGLRAGETILDGSALPSFSGAVAGYGPPQTQPGSLSFWTTVFDWPNNSVRTALGLTNVAHEPQFYIERVLATDDTSGVDKVSQDNLSTPYIYRVTSRAEGGSVDSVTFLQSTYKPH